MINTCQMCGGNKQIKAKGLCKICYDVDYRNKAKNKATLTETATTNDITTPDSELATLRAAFMRLKNGMSYIDMPLDDLIDAAIDNTKQFRIQNTEITRAMGIMQADQDIDTLTGICQDMMDEFEILKTESASRITDLELQLKEANDSLQAMTENTAAIIPPPGSMANHITTACQELCAMLIGKNQSYGNSAAEPVRIFSRSGPLEQIMVRIDDKLSRLMRGSSYPGDNDIDDLTGYLILLRAVRSWLKEQVNQHLEQTP